MHPRFTGLIAAPHTPFTPDAAAPNLAMIERQAEKLIRNEVVGAFVCGSTGEGVSMSVAERIAVTRRWTEVTRGTGLRTLAHVGHTSQSDAMALAEAAQRDGAAGIAAMAPFYFVPASVEALVDWLAPVAAAAPGLPFYYYHIPALTGARLPMRPFLEAASRRIPTLAGVKFTHPDLMEYSECLHWEEGRYQILWGVDEWMLPALAVGATAFIGSTYNYSAPLYHRLMAAHRAGDSAAAGDLSETVMRSVRALIRYPGVAAGKAIMTRAGIPVGPPRSPLVPLTAEEGDALYAEHVALGAV